MKLRRRLYSGLIGLAAATLVNAAAADQTHHVPSHLTVPSAVTSFIASQLPESVHVPNAFLSGSVDPNLVLTAPAKLSVTFLGEGAGYLNTFGYFVYSLNGNSIQITDRGVIFQNASRSDDGGSLTVGDTVALDNPSGGNWDGSPRAFPAGSRIGFFVIADGASYLSDWDQSPLLYPATVSAMNGSRWVSYQNRPGAARGVVTSLDALNYETYQGRPELARHLAMFESEGFAGFLENATTHVPSRFFVLGFDDQNRVNGSDHDFNDVLFMVSATPESAVARGGVPYVDPTNTDPDGDGVTSMTDAFPEDADRAFDTRVPASSYSTIGFEDMYPTVGDADFNDAVVSYATNVVTHANGRVKEVVGTYHLVARGAGYDASFGVGIDGVPSNATGHLWVQTFSPSGAESNVGPIALEGLLTTLADGSSSLRLDDLMPHIRQSFPQTYTDAASSGAEVNPLSVRFRVLFTSSVDAGDLAASPFDPYLKVHHGADVYDIHLPGKQAFTGRPASLPSENRSPSFMDANSYPWAILIPYDWRYPLEAKHIQDAYGQFSSWRTSRGTSNRSWYTTPVEGNVIDPIPNVNRERPWTIGAGIPRTTTTAGGSTCTCSYGEPCPNNDPAACGPLLCGRYVGLDPGSGPPFGTQWEGPWASGSCSGSDGLILDTQTGLTWQRLGGTWGTWSRAQVAEGCAARGMRLPTVAEVMGITGAVQSCPDAFPCHWVTWTSDEGDPMCTQYMGVPCGIVAGSGGFTQTKPSTSGDAGFCVR